MYPSGALGEPGAGSEQPAAVAAGMGGQARLRLWKCRLGVGAVEALFTNYIFSLKVVRHQRGFQLRDSTQPNPI